MRTTLFLLVAPVLFASLACTGNPTAALEPEATALSIAASTESATAPSAIGTRLREDAALNPDVFALFLMPYLMNDATDDETFALLDAHLATNGGAPLTNGEQHEIRRMKRFYRQLKYRDQAEYRDKLRAYSQLLRVQTTGIISVEWWDDRMGLGTSYDAEDVVGD